MSALGIEMVGPGEEEGPRGRLCGPGSDLAHTSTQTDIPNVLWSLLGYGKYKMKWESREGMTNPLGM